MPLPERTTGVPAPASSLVASPTGIPLTLFLFGKQRLNGFEIKIDTFNCGNWWKRK